MFHTRTPKQHPRWPLAHALIAVEKVTSGSTDSRVLSMFYGNEQALPSGPDNLLHPKLSTCAGTLLTPSWLDKVTGQASLLQSTGNARLKCSTTNEHFRYFKTFERAHLEKDTSSSEIWIGYAHVKRETGGARLWTGLGKEGRGARREVHGCGRGWGGKSSTALKTFKHIDVKSAGKMGLTENRTNKCQFQKGSFG